MIKITNIRIPYSADQAGLKRKIASLCRTDEKEIRSVRLLKRALDARKKQEISYLISAAVSLTPEAEKRALKYCTAAEPYTEPKQETPVPGSEDADGRIVVAGMGPAGLFAALILAKNGYHPLLVERGRCIEQRVKDIELFWNSSVLDEESNVMFGEGGAGTFSDGKLTSRSKDPRSNLVMEIFHAHGAPEEITYLAKPHIGTDLLRKVIVNLRKDIEENGGEIRFGTRLEDVVIEDGRLTRIVLKSASGCEKLPCASLVLATGQGARDTYRMLADRGLVLKPKPFAVGVRVEHPQTLINKAQFGDAWNDPVLGAAEYRLTAKSGERGVYTFCMCPGGYVVAASSGKDQVVVNGMSNFARDAENANSAVVVQVEPADFGNDPFSGIRFCEDIEKRAFLAGGGDYTAPACRVEDFLDRRKPGAFRSVKPSYRPGVCPADIWKILPEYVAGGVSDGIRQFAKQLKGYDFPDAVITAPETRTSSPVRIQRGEDGQAENGGNIYPVGEGAGYAGGIVSAAIDGMRAAERIISRFRRTNFF